MFIFGLWTVLVALVISVVAAYYSIVGLVAIFAAAAVPIIIMGAALEVGKLTTAVWLHSYWDRANMLMRTYLTLALVLLMFITSMGIFGFLSKAHIEQTAGAQEGVAQLERIEADINRNTDIIARSEQKIVALENTDNNKDAAIQEKITLEQERIDGAYARQQPAIDQQNEIIQQELAARKELLEPYENRLALLDEQIALVQQYVDSNEIKKLQGLIGAKQDGQYGPQTAARVEKFRLDRLAERDEQLAKLDEVRSQPSTVIESARAEIVRLRSIAEQQIQTSNELIDRLRAELGRGQQDDATAQIAELQERIKESNTEIDALYERKYEIEVTQRALEAEVGPVKYIAELVYGEDAGRNTLEAAVRWVIIILVAVFDPLAVVLVLAGITMMEDARRQRLPQKSAEIVQNNAQESVDVQDKVQIPAQKKTPKKRKAVDKKPEVVYTNIKPMQETPIAEEEHMTAEERRISEFRKAQLRINQQYKESKSQQKKTD